MELLKLKVKQGGRAIQSLAEAVEKPEEVLLVIAVKTNLEVECYTGENTRPLFKEKFSSNPEPIKFCQQQGFPIPCRGKGIVDAVAFSAAWCLSDIGEELFGNGPVDQL